MRKTQFLILFFFTFLVKKADAQTITNYTSTDGLIDNFVECITVDNNDNIWFGTTFGISMYDGLNWTTYTSANYPGMASDNIKVITAANNGDVWIGTDFGASKFDGVSWVTYTSANGLNNSQVKCIEEDINGGIWIGTHQGISYFNGSNWNSYGSPQLHWSGVNSIAFDSQGDKWLGSPLGGITHYNGNTFTPYDTSSGLLSQNVTSIIVDNQDNKWVGTGSGMSVLNSNNSSFIHHTKMYLLPPPDTLNPVVDIDQENTGNIWTAIYVGYLAEGGVAYWDGSQWIDFDHTDGLAGPNVRGLSIDSQNNVWIATSTGVSMISAISNSISNSLNFTNRKLIQITDILGRVIPYQNNKLFFYFYDDGSIEKKINLK